MNEYKPVLTRMLGSLVSHLASPTQDDMKHPEMHKKSESEKTIFWVKKISKKNCGKNNPKTKVAFSVSPAGKVALAAFVSKL